MHHGGHTVLERRPDPAVPEQLRVEVRVRVDEAGGDHLPAGVDLGARAAREAAANVLDATVADPEIAPERGEAGAVDDATVADHDDRAWILLHGRTSSRRCQGCPRRSVGLFRRAGVEQPARAVGDRA